MKLNKYVYAHNKGGAEIAQSVKRLTTGWTVEESQSR
jgi:hypothetical protein